MILHILAWYYLATVAICFLILGLMPVPELKSHWRLFSAATISILGGWLIWPLVIGALLRYWSRPNDLVKFSPTRTVTYVARCHGDEDTLVIDLTKHRFGWEFWTAFPDQTPAAKPTEEERLSATIGTVPWMSDHELSDLLRDDEDLCYMPLERAAVHEALARLLLVTSKNCHEKPSPQLSGSRVSGVEDQTSVPLREKNAGGWSEI